MSVDLLLYQHHPQDEQKQCSFHGRDPHCLNKQRMLPHTLGVEGAEGVSPPHRPMTTIYEAFRFMLFPMLQQFPALSPLLQ